MNEFNVDQTAQIVTGLKNQILGQQSLFEDARETPFVEQFYARILKENKIDICPASSKKDIDTIQ